MAVPFTHTLSLTTLPTVIHVAIAAYLPALALVRLGAQSRSFHAFFPPLATGRLEVTGKALREDPYRPADRAQRAAYADHHSVSFARLLRRMPRLYIVTLTGSGTHIQSVAEHTLSLLRSRFELCHQTVIGLPPASYFTSTFFVSGRALLPPSYFRPKEVLLGYSSFMKEYSSRVFEI